MLTINTLREGCRFRHWYTGGQCGPYFGLFSVWIKHVPEVGGTGLGLSITKNVIQMHHGVIDVESTPGGRTTLSMRIPLNYVSRQEERL